MIFFSQTLVVPAIISLILFLLSTFVLYPLWQRYRNRYSQYLPIDTLSEQTSSLRARITGGLSSLIFTSRWSTGFADRLVVGGRPSFDSEDGEELEDVDESTGRGGNIGDSIDSSRRLSRE
ncbi:uncharacterized protein PODANS_2_5550 [Podospora anserina S mat+]|uniref:Podospora anserina S mat+ genomic DNA chromosome 2, supercontig 2 n=1 Tax=Podospora anserina (strain S / ATCC MYA-4624 / DSM 980 / FGSC 10383) TaxID=515849 RepID=B2B5R7_PODAN|nr:uncharacterized protein PODANS_2_5550 [Podospora anserina S mat+]CAP73142.1 unnamed protein product [Podospora anserina S mat+]CDP25544.1 Putative protein of unknown function [Podospora anserina S mat+]